jgi:hypothetical protein
MAVAKPKLFTQLSDPTKSWLPSRGEPILLNALRN